jgi:hypothetical protein
MEEEGHSNTSPSHPPPRPRRALEFITFTDPGTARNATNRQRVRRQAMRDFHGRLDNSRRRRDEIGQAIAPWLQMATQSRWSVPDVDQHEANEDVLVPNPVTYLGISRVDPFFQYPVRMGYRERELCDHRE